MNEIQKVVLKYDNNKNIYLVNGKEVEKDVWLRTKGAWETEETYNHIKKFIDKWGFTNHDYYTENNVEVWVFTTKK